MVGTPTGGQKAAQTNLKKHGKDFYKRIGKKGGQNGHAGGFASNHELAKIAGRKGGKKSKRGPAKQPKQPHYKGNKIQNARDLYNVLRSYIPTQRRINKNAYAKRFTILTHPCAIRKAPR